jgi:PAS domain S-box-containing protein
MGKQMEDQGKTKQQLIAELTELRQRVVRLEEAEPELQRATNRAQQYLDVAGVIIVVLDKEGRVVLLNRKGCDILGYQEAELLHKNWFDVCVPDDKRAEVVAVFRQLMAGNLTSAEYYDNSVRTRSGEERIIAWHNALLTDEQGRLIGTLSSGTDITEQKRAEEALQNSEHRYRTLTESTTDMIYIADRTGKILYANRSAAAWLGNESDGIVGKRPDDLFAPQIAQRQTASIAIVFQTGEVFDTDDLYHLGGNETWLTTRLIPLRDELGRVVSVMGISRDITERMRVRQALKKAHDELERKVEERTAELAEANQRLKHEIEVRRLAEEMVRQSERKFRNYFEQGLIGMAATAPDGCWLEVNDRICEILGYSREELLEKTWEELTHPDDLTKDLDQFHRLLAGEIPYYVLEKRFVRKDGSTVYTTIHIRAFQREDGSVDHIVGLMEDITERMRAEEALRQSHDELRAIYDQVVDGILIADADRGGVIRVNAAYCRMVGYSEAEMKTISSERVHPPEVMPKVREHFEEIKRGNVARLESVPFLRRDGKVRYVDVVSSPIYYNRRSCWISFFRDITERKLAEEALVESEAKYRQLVEITDTGYAILDT